MARIYASEHGDHGRILLCHDLCGQQKIRRQTAVFSKRCLYAGRDACGILRGNAGQPCFSNGCVGLFGGMDAFARTDLPVVYGLLVRDLFFAFVYFAEASPFGNFVEFTKITLFFHKCVV